MSSLRRMETLVSFSINFTTGDNFYDFILALFLYIKSHWEMGLPYKEIVCSSAVNTCRQERQDISYRVASAAIVLWQWIVVKFITDRSIRNIKTQIRTWNRTSYFSVQKGGSYLLVRRPDRFRDDSEMTIVVEPSHLLEVLRHFHVWFVFNGIFQNISPISKRAVVVTANTRE